MSFITLSYVTLATSAKSLDGAIRRRCVMRNCHVVVSKNGNKPLHTQVRRVAPSSGALCVRLRILTPGHEWVTNERHAK